MAGRDSKPSEYFIRDPANWNGCGVDQSFSCAVAICVFLLLVLFVEIGGWLAGGAVMLPLLVISVIRTPAGERRVGGATRAAGGSRAVD